MAVYRDEVMVRGTTPLCKWNTKVDLSDLEVMYVTYKQGNYTVEKKKSDCIFGEGGFEHTLTQDETLGFDSGLRAKNVICQIRGRFADGTTVASWPPIEVPVGLILKGGVI